MLLSLLQWHFLVLHCVSLYNCLFIYFFLVSDITALLICFLSNSFCSYASCRLTPLTPHIITVINVFPFFVSKPFGSCFMSQCPEIHPLQGHWSRWWLVLAADKEIYTENIWYKISSLPWIFPGRKWNYKGSFKF